MDGALALAVPTKKGQHLQVKNYNGSDIIWKSYDVNGDEWFKSKISLFDFSAVETTDEEKSKYLKKLLKSAVRINSEFLSKWKGFKVESRLEFPKEWGLGSSSTLTHLVAEWADIHPIELHFQVSDGSGYDVACAGAESALLYRVTDESVAYEPVSFDPSFSQSLYFVYLNEKTSSDDAIRYYFKKAKGRKQFCKDITAITEKMFDASSLAAFAKLMEEHEDLVAKTLDLEKVKDRLFGDYWGSIKSLGAWGGDFVLATSDKSATETSQYFKDKGYDTCIPYAEMIG